MAKQQSTYKHIALITGAGTGIGRDLTVLLAEKGMRVYATMRKPERMAEVQTLVEAAGVAEHVSIQALDVTNPEDILKIRETILRDEAEHLKNDAELILINNAGFGIAGAVEDLQIDDFRRIMETNYFGAVALTKAFLADLRFAGRGRIIQVSSGFGRVGAPLMGAYNASKFALEGFSEALRYEMLPFGVFVSLIEPGPVKTEFNENMAESPGHADSPYAKLYERADLVVEKSQIVASEARDVSKAVVKAIEARYPALRYEVGIAGFAAKVTNQFAPQGVIEGIYRFI
ncbi:MAG: SDR family oxidoreductase [bacterium]|nr:SDR family oxidoreductase [bacterium]